MKSWFKIVGLCSVLLALVIAAGAQSVTFNYVGSAVNWTVPTGVTSIHVDCQAAGGGEAGGGSITGGSTTPGKGARVQCSLSVIPGQVLIVSVGGKGQNGTGLPPAPTGGGGGFNGGGNAYPRPIGATGTPGGGGGGGGSSDIRIGGAGASSRVVAAGGGGGAGWQPLCGAGSEDQPGGDGGYTAGGATSCVATLTGSGYTIALAGGASTPVSAPGGGGSLSCSSCTYVPGSNGTLLTGGSTAVAPNDGGIAGAGGGGYYGGGGGCWTGGGGGSSYTNSAYASAVVYTTGYNSGNGVIIFNYSAGTLNVHNINSEEIKVYPNPVNEMLHVESPAAVKAVVTDMTGKTLLEKTDASILNIKGFAPGLYLLRLYDMNGNCVKVQKLEKQ